MIKRQPTEHPSFATALAIVLLMATRIHNCNSQQLSRNWYTACKDKNNYYASYDSTHPGLTMLDALNAQTFYIESRNPDIGLYNKFAPVIPGSNKRRNVVIKSIIELIRMKEKYEALAIGAMNQDPQLALAEILYAKVAEESCLWLNESPDINIPDCSNIDASKLEEIYFRMELYDTLKTTLSDVEETISSVAMEELPSHQIFYCAWMNDRILDNCADENSSNNDYRNTLNSLCNHRNTRICNPELCRIAP